MDSYATMDVKLKQDLKKNLLPYAKQIGLEGICYPSFIYVLLTLLLPSSTTHMLSHYSKKDFKSLFRLQTRP